MPVLERRPVRLRVWRDDDVDLVRRVHDDPMIPLITTVPTSGRQDDALAWIERQHERLSSGYGYSFAIADLATDRPVGQIILRMREIQFGRAAVGYWIAREHRRKGYAARALRLITDWADTIEEVGRVELHVEPRNEASWRAAEEAGYQREGLLRDYQQIGEERRSMWVYSHLPDRD
ncbi:GNAT family N-acetyltransferase [Naumannella sp. ID2617S]|nr:GNAT family N-acetyltransferase [Naumannella sp. ID2617S]